MQEHIYDRESGSSSGATHVPDQASTVLSPRTLRRCDSGLPCDSQNGTGITGNVFERPLASRRTIFCNLQHSKNFGIFLTGIEAWCCRNNKEKRVKWKENRWTRRFFHPTSRVGVACWIILVEFILTVVWCYFEIKSWKISWLYGISKLESQLQEWGMYKNSRSSDHNALDQRSWDCKSQQTNL